MYGKATPGCNGFNSFMTEVPRFLYDGDLYHEKVVVNSFHSFTIFAKALHHLFDKVLNTPLHSPKI